MYKVSTPPRVRTQNHRCMTLSSCGTGTDSAHSDFASDVYVANRPCMCTAPDGQLRIPWYTRLHVAAMLFADTRYTTLLKYMKSHSYPKSTIEIQSLLSLQAALPALKSLENCPVLPQLPPNSIQVNQLDLSEGPLFVQTFYTTPSANTKSQLHHSAAAERVPVGHTAILRDM